MENKKKSELRLVAMKRRDELRQLKHAAQQHMLNPYGFQSLEDSVIWSRTITEDESLATSNQKLRGYKARHATQQVVLDFAKLNNKKKYIEFKKKDKRELDTYCSASSYWKKASVTVRSPEDQNMKIVYYENEEMKSVITEYLGKAIITTVSSFDNMLRHMEGKIAKHKKQFDKTKPGNMTGGYSERLDKTVPKKEDVKFMQDRLTGFNSN